MVSEHPSERGSGPADDQELPRLALVALSAHGDNHALAPSAERGPALCGLGESRRGWVVNGFTDRLFRIDCHSCRQRAAELLSALGDDAAVPPAGGEE